MKRLVFSTALTAAIASTPVAAQEDKQFEGPRAEVLVGYDRFDAGLDGFEDDGNAEDVFYGAAVGYDFQSVGIVFGLEGEIASSGNGESVDVVETIDGSVYDGTVSLEDGINLYGGARVGVPAGETGLFYFKAGFAHTNLDLDLEGTVDGEPASDGADISFSGLRLGGGYEYSFGGAYAKLEYRYTPYSDGDVKYDGESADLNAFGDIDLERHQVVFGLGMRF